MVRFLIIRILSISGCSPCVKSQPGPRDRPNACGAQPKPEQAAFSQLCAFFRSYAHRIQARRREDRSKRFPVFARGKPAWSIAVAGGHPEIVSIPGIVRWSPGASEARPTPSVLDPPTPCGSGWFSSGHGREYCSATRVDHSTDRGP